MFPVARPGRSACSLARADAVHSGPSHIGHPETLRNNHCGSAADSDTSAKDFTPPSSYLADGVILFTMRQNRVGLFGLALVLFLISAPSHALVDPENRALWKRLTPDGSIVVYDTDFQLRLAANDVPVLVEKEGLGAVPLVVIDDAQHHRSRVTLSPRWPLAVGSMYTFGYLHREGDGLEVVQFPDAARRLWRVFPPAEPNTMSILLERAALFGLVPFVVGYLATAALLARRRYVLKLYRE